MEKKFGAESKPWAQFTINKGFSGKHILYYYFLLNFFYIYSVLLLSLGLCPALEKLLKDFAATYASGNVSVWYKLVVLKPSFSFYLL